MGIVSHEAFFRLRAAEQFVEEGVAPKPLGGS